LSAKLLSSLALKEQNVNIISAKSTKTSIFEIPDINDFLECLEVLIRYILSKYLYKNKRFINPGNRFFDAGKNRIVYDIAGTLQYAKERSPPIIQKTGQLLIR